MSGYNAPPSPSKASSRSISMSIPTARPLQPRDLNAKPQMAIDSHAYAHSHAHAYASRKDAFNESLLDTPPPSSPTEQHYAPFQRSSSVTVPYSSSPPRSAHSSPPPPSSSPVKVIRTSRPSLPLQPASASLRASDANALKDPHAGLESLEEGNDCTHVLYGSYTHALMLGRCKPAGQTDSQRTSQEDSERVALTSKPIQHVALPNTARHVSRRHAVVEWLPFSPAAATAGNHPKRPLVGGFVVRILGQNGLIVDGKRRREGHVLRLEAGRSTIDFFGVKTQFQVRPQAHKPLSLLEAEANQRQAADSQVKRPRPSVGLSDGSSPFKRPEAARVPSLSGSASTKSMAQLLSTKHSAYVKRTTLGKDSELPPSPPSSSPPPMAMRDDGDGEGEGDGGMPEPASPTLGRGAQATDLPALPSLDAVAPRGQALADDSDSEGESAVEPQAKTAAVESPSSDAESELTPSPTPSPRLQPRVLSEQAFAKPAKPSHNKKAAGAAAASPKPLTNSQISMPPPRLPASAQTQSQSQAPRDAEALRDALRDRARSCVGRIAPTYDLEGLLAGAIVFHRTATISASEAVRSVLAGTLGMLRGEVGNAHLMNGSAAALSEPLEHGTVVPGWGAEDLLVRRAGLSQSQAADRWASVARRAWTEQLEIQLQSKAMFGQIQRAGKDASGNSLEHWYYYNKDGDEDADRAANLGALAKPIRGALKTHKPIFWKKSAYPRSADEEAQAVQSANESTAARVYATAWKDDREWDLFTDSQISPAIVSTSTSAAYARPAAANASARSGSLVDEKRIWEETQPEEREQTWDRLGDMDWSVSARGSPAASSQQVGGGGNKRRKRSAASVARDA